MAKAKDTNSGSMDRPLERGMLKSIRKRLLERPELVEPGVLLQSHLLQLAGGWRVKLHGVDVLGRPCLVGCFRALDAAAYDWALGVACAFRDGLAGSNPVYSRGREPRIFMASPMFRSEDLARLRLLDQAGSFRGLRVHRDGAGEWQTELSFPRSEFPDDREWLADAPADCQAFLGRLIAAARRGGVRAEIQGRPWPMLLTSDFGPVAALHRDRDRMLFLSVNAPGDPPEMLELVSEEKQDQAIDRLLRALAPRIAVTLE